jgi:hypothetical protein
MDTPKITFLRLPAVLLLCTLAACHQSGRNKAATADSDSVAPHPVTSMRAEPLPAVPAGAKVFFRNLKDGQTVSSPFKVEMGVSGMSVDTAGVVRPASGHHHLLIDAGDSVATGVVVPQDAHHLHFGKAQTETELDLPPGQHRLTLQFADGLHRSYGSRLSASITVQVKK